MDKSSIFQLFDADTYFLDGFGTDKTVVGIYDGRTPSLVVADAEMIRGVLQKQSNQFYDRTVFMDKDPSIMHLTLDNLKGAQWKRVRQLLTPAFTPAKLRGMIPLIVECAENLVADLEEKAKGNATDIKQVSARFTLRAIASIGFGIDLKSSSEESKFTKAARELFDMFSSGYVVMLCKCFSQVANNLFDFFLNSHSDVSSCWICYS